MKDATENEIGTISYDFFINEEFIPKILTMMELNSLKMLGPVTEEIDNFFVKGGWTYDVYPLAM
jgi:hypothetical protein